MSTTNINEDNRINQPARVKQPAGLEQPTLSCPFASAMAPIVYPVSCPHYHGLHPEPAASKLNDNVRKEEVGGKYRYSEDTAMLLADIGGGERIRDLCTRFYAKVFLDQHIGPLIFKDDGAIEHGLRLGNWIIEKMGGEGTPWTDSGRYGLRAATHSHAWRSPYRDPKDLGKRFKLDDCRIWMRLMFWSGREIGLDQFTTFWNWYISFISHFVGVYEYSAPPFTFDDSIWSCENNNIQKYIQNNYSMVDVIGIEHTSYNYFE